MGVAAMNKRVGLPLAVAVIAGVIIGIIIASSFELWTPRISAFDKAELAKIKQDLATAGPKAEELNEAYRTIYNLVNPSVVSVVTEKRIQEAGGLQEFEGLPPQWRQFFGLPGKPAPPRVQKEIGEGSGVSFGSRTSSRPTRRSTRATAAGRW
jgi:S1-C subfamily serine protease